MRRFFLAAAIISVAASGPLAAQAGDREIAEQIIQKLKVQRDSGALKDFSLDLKVDKGVALLRGSVRDAAHKDNMIAAAKGIEGVSQVVDEITVITPAPTAVASQSNESPKSTEPTKDSFSFKQALAASKPTLTPLAPAPAVVQQAMEIGVDPSSAAWELPGQVQVAAANEPASSENADQSITSAVVATLGNAQRQGRLKGFGVDVNTQDGRVHLSGRASSQQHRQLITQLVRQTPGVVDVIEEITVTGGAAANEMAHPAPLQPVPGGFAPTIHGVSTPVAGGGFEAQVAPYRMPTAGGEMPAQPVGMHMHGGPVQTPYPMAPYAGANAAPRYEQPYLPNYAWPGYAAYPNYAAVTYPQQYSPSAWPYIGPFYPYPQVPLGWRKVSLEWDDGWWFLDFTDR